MKNSCQNLDNVSETPTVQNSYKNRKKVNLYYYLKRQVYFGSCNKHNHSQTMHPTENFISINFLQMSCMITWAQKNQPPTSEDVSQFYISKIQGQAKPYNYTQLHKGNYFVLKYFHISNFRSKTKGLDFQYPKQTNTQLFSEKFDTYIWFYFHILQVGLQFGNINVTSTVSTGLLAWYR